MTENAVAALDEFDTLTVYEAIRLVLNTDGSDHDFPTIEEVDEECRELMAQLKIRLSNEPYKVEGDTPFSSVDNNEELSLAVWALDKVDKNEQQPTIEEGKIGALIALSERLFLALARQS